MDIYNTDNSNTGNNNICDNNSTNWNDTGTTGCTYPCPFCKDDDGDGYGVCPNCNTTSGCTYDGHDCDDSSSTIYPGSSSEDNNCNVIDDNCNGRVDENCDRGKSHTYTCYKDADNDGYGNATDSIAQTIDRKSTRLNSSH